MKLIIGLGNPGKQYENTRHNIGFRIVDSLAEKLGPSEWKASEKHQAQILETNFQLHTANYRLILVKPKTFMNLSGESVASLVNFYKLDPAKDILICGDDKDMLFGKIRERSEGTSGGHNGLKSIIESLGTEQFQRLKFGIGHEDQKIATDTFVLSGFTQNEEDQIPKLIEKTISLIMKWLEND